MKSLVYKFTCASCSSSYICETCRHFKTKIEQHIKKDNRSGIFKHLNSTTTCFDSYYYLSFKMIESKVFSFLCHLLFSLSLTLIISIFYCLKYTSLLLHLITAHFESHLFLSSIIFILPDTNYRYLTLRYYFISL